MNLPLAGMTFDSVTPEAAPLATPPIPMEMTRRRVLGVGSTCGILLALGLLGVLPYLQEGIGSVRSAGAAAVTLGDEEAVEALDRARRKLEATRPREAYLVVNTTDNRIVLMSPKGVVHEGLCSTGSNVELRGSDGKKWVFATPRGEFRVLKKRRNPVWTKPDWAFVEEGKPIPPLGSPERVERGVLGAYSLSIGDGYLIHGTLYQRMLGQPVSHGCVRLGDEDLEKVYQTLRVGSPVYIY